MIVIDTSALIAIVLREPAGSACRLALSAEPDLSISAATLAETLIVSQNRGIGDIMHQLLAGLPIVVHPVDDAFARRAAQAYKIWGKAIHPAGLNIMDCFAYALALEHRAALLFVGNDFSRTDIPCAIPWPH